jgi:arylsulfatase A-like enzyme
VVWSAAVQDSAGRDIRIATSGEGINRLRVSLEDPCQDCSTDPQAELTLGDDFLRTVRSQGPSEKPHVFIYVIDTLRADALEAYGAPLGSSPKIAEFAQDAVVYSNTHAASAWTLPSTVSLLTGVQPDRHQVMRGDVQFSEDRSKSLPRLLSDEGYQTVGISQSYVVSAGFGLAAPFERFFLNDHLNSFALRSQRVRRFFLEWLYSERNGSSPILAYLHTVDPHAPYEPIGPFRKPAIEHPGKLDRQEYLPTVFGQKGHLEDAAELRHMKALYEGEVQYADAEFGKFIDLLKQLNLYEESVVVLVSDHGEEFGEHGGVDHGRSVYEELLRIPLIIKYPGRLGAGTSSDVPASTVDVAPTILELAGRATRDLQLDGRSLHTASLSPDAGGRIVFAQLDV